MCPVCDGAGEVRRAQRTAFGQFVNITACNNCNGEGQVIREVCPACRGDSLERKDFYGFNKTFILFNVSLSSLLGNLQMNVAFLISQSRLFI